jgi:hypothetical protein
MCQLSPAIEQESIRKYANEEQKNCSQKKYKKENIFAGIYI